MDLNGSFGEWLRGRRKALDLTQAELADQVGCSTMTVRKIEADERRPSKQISERLADVLAISLEDRAAFIAFARRMDPPPNDDYSDLKPTGNLPPQATPFIGRERELAQIAERLADPTCRLLTLVGPGGIGKTRLALQAASDRVGDYGDGVYFVSLTPVGETTFIPAAIGNVLQFSFYGQDDPAVQIVNYLRGKHMLLVLDNYEHLLEGVGLLTDILVNAPRVRLLVTSRERLNMAEEWTLPVSGLPYPQQATNGDMSRYSAVELFVQTAQRIQPGFSLEGNREAVIDICRTVEGMPLGLELAATWLRAMPCGQIAEQIRRDVDFLATPLRNIAERHRSLRVVFEHSWGLLTEIEQGVLAKLTVFRGGCDTKASEIIAGASLPLLAGLMDKSLVRLNATGRYEMHELLRQFAADNLLESGQADMTRQRHLQYFLELAEQLEPHLFGANQVPVWDRLEMELDNIRAALDWADTAGDAESGLRLSGALGWYWNRRVHWTEGREWLVKFLAAGGSCAPGLRAIALHHLLELSYEITTSPAYIEARSREAVALLDLVEDRRSRAWLLTSLGFVHRFPNGLNQTFLEEALALFGELGDQWGICEAMVRLAGDRFAQGDYLLAEALKEKGIQLARQAGDKIVLAWMLTLLATNKLSQGMVDTRTERLYQESMSLFSELRFKSGITYCLHGLAALARIHNETERAKLLFRQCLQSCEQIGKSYGLGCMICLAEIFLDEQDSERAARLLGALNARVEMLQKCFMLPGIYAYDLTFERALTAARAQLGEDAFAVAFAEGQRMSFDQAVAYALADAALVETANEF